MTQVIGVDEVGRGAWAGPLLVVAARQISELPSALKDSKELSRSVRSQLYELITRCCELGEGWVMPAEVDHLGLTNAMKLGVARALDNLSAKQDETIVIDGHINYCDHNFVRASAVIGADKTFPIVSAASIYAKVVRDRYMSELPERYHMYEFEKHVGYGTALHQQLLKKHGVSDIHRTSYKPIRALL